MKYSDLVHLPEDDRITAIGEATLAGNIVGIALEDNSKKIKRYLKKLKNRYPTVRHISTGPGLVAGTVLIKFGPEAKH